MFVLALDLEAYTYFSITPLTIFNYSSVTSRLICLYWKTKCTIDIIYPELKGTCRFNCFFNNNVYMLYLLDLCLC